MKNEKILIFGDMHLPYHHRDTLAFLKAVAAKYKPNKIYSTGDLVDYHALSFHETDADLMSAGKELQVSIKELKKLYKIFPECTVVDSNHGSMALRKAKYSGIPIKFIKKVEEVYESPKGWKWVNDLTIKMNNKQKLFITHGMLANSLKLAQQMGMCVIQGHYHSQLSIEFGSSPSQLYWGAMAGCFIDSKSMAFAYNKLQSKRPLLGCILIENGIPKVIPMIINNNRRWNKKVS